MSKPLTFIILFGLIFAGIGIAIDKWERPYYPYSEPAYGQIYFDDESSPKTVSLPLVDTYYNITYLNYSDSNDGIFEFNNSKMRVLVNGTYQAIISSSISGGNSKVYEIALYKNDAEIEACENHARTNTVADEQSLSFNCIFTASYYDNFSLMARTYTAPASNMIIHQLSWNMIQIK